VDCLHFFIFNRLHSYTMSSYILNEAAETNCFKKTDGTETNLQDEELIHRELH